MNYFNSTVEKKEGKCLDCGNDTFLTAGRCSFCYSNYRKKLMLEKQKEKSKVRSLIQSPKNKILLEEKGIIKNEEKTMLELWYLARKYEMTGKCEECGAWTNKTHDKYYRWSCCHIVAKAYVKSVSLNPNNCIELCQIHHQEYDAGFERAKRMKCFGLIKRKFDTFKHLIPDSEKRWINPYLLT